MALEALLTTQIIGLQPLLDAKLGGSTGSTDNRVLRSDGTGGVTVQNSGVTIDDSGNISGVVALTTTGKVAVPAGDYFNAGLEVGTTGLYGSNALTTRIGGQECSYLTQSVLNLRSSIIIGWTGTTSATGVVDVRMARNGSGQLDIRGDSGLRVRNFANSANAPVVCSEIDFGANAGFDRKIVPQTYGVLLPGNSSLSGTFTTGNNAFALNSGINIAFNTAGGIDAFIYRVGSGFGAANLDVRATNGLRIRNQANSADAALACGAITASGLVSVGTYTFGTLPAAASNAGALAQITDSSVTTNGTNAAGGGSSRAIVFSDGTDWIVAVA